MLAQFVAGLSATLVATATPTIVTDLQASTSAGVWLIAATILGNTATTAIWGRLCDLVARRTILIAALLVYLAGTVAAATAPTIALLMAARATQGVGLGGIGATVLVVAAGLVAPRVRGQVSALIQTTMTTSMVVGPLVGGVAAETAGWRWCFAICIPFAVASIGVISRRLREIAAPPGTGSATDYPGAVLVATGVPAVLISITLLTGDGPTSLGAGFAAVGVVALTLLVRVELRVAEPLIPLRLLGERNLLLILLGAFCFGSTLFGGTVYVTQYLQWGLGVSPATAGLLLAPMATGTVTASWLAGRAVAATGRLRPVLVAAALLLLIGNIAATCANLAPLPLALTGALLISAGTGLSMPYLILTAQTLSTPDRIGSVSAAVSLLFTLGGTVGLVVYGAALDMRVNALLFAGASRTEAYTAGMPVVFLLSAAMTAIGSIAVMLLPGIELDPPSVVDGPVRPSHPGKDLSMRGYVDTDWGQVHYRHSGPAPTEADAVVVLLHESPRSSAVYEPILPALGEQVAAFAFDTPGFGLSDPAPEGASIPDYGRILLQAIDALGIDAFVPVGMKTGGFLVTEMITQLQGTRVDRAVLYALEEPDPVECEYWAQNWAPALEVTADGAIFASLWQKNVGIYGSDCQDQIAQCVADAVVNLEHYNSIYPAVFRHMPQSWKDTLALVGSGIDITIVAPPHGHMTPEAPITYADVPGARVVEMPVTGQFPARATGPFVNTILQAAIPAHA